ncbi:hypothetical protein [Arthrobacter sp. R-11]|uniref:hypothetical protein n=1 Tax=Arthrobacter sp. R-11 TaxID=3404053 RepID=UPI003CF43839
MALNREQIEPVLQSVSPWLSNANITGLTVGPKAVSGRQTDDLAVVVHVVEKKPSSELGIDDLPVPPFVEVHAQDDGGAPRVEQVPTDVVESGVIRLCQLDGRVRPAPGGYKIAVSDGFFTDATGTLGVNITWGGRFRLLTNNHVISMNGTRGPTVYQPDWALWGNTLTTVSGYEPVVTYANRNQPSPVFNRTDLAWCDMTATDGDPDIHGIGVPVGLRGPAVNDAVQWIGKTTGVVQNATIASVTGRFVMEFMDGRWAWFRDVITFNQGTVRQGDSGSAVFATADSKVVGLIFANDSHNAGFGVQIP